MVINTYLSIISLNINGLNAPMKRHRLAEWVRKQDPHICCLRETPLRSADTLRVNVTGWTTVFHANAKEAKVGWLLVPDRMDFETKATARDREGHDTLVKGPSNKRT